MDRVPARIKAALALLLGAFGSTCYADEGMKPVFSKRTDFRLPVQISDVDRGYLRELKLFVKQGSGQWECKESAPPTQTMFSHRVSTDGEYWFTFVSVDQSGVAFPADLDQQAPGLRVIVDTKAPEVDLHPIPVANGDVMLKCNIKDANPDYGTFRVEYEERAGKWTALQSLSKETPTIFPLPDEKILKSRVRVFIADRAGNSRHLEFDLDAPPSLRAPRDLSAATARPTPVVVASIAPTTDTARTPGMPRIDLNPSTMLQPVPMTGPALAPAPQLTPAPQAAPAPAPAPQPMVQAPFPALTPVPTPTPMPTPMPMSTPRLMPNLSPTPMIAPMPAPMVAPIPPQTAEPSLAPVPQPQPMIAQPASAAPSSVPPQPSANVVPPESTTVNKQTTPAPIAINQGEVQVLNTSRFALDYAIDEVRPGSPARVEFWATKDRGRSWEKLTDKSAGRSPAELHLPGDGLYGVALRVVTGPSDVPVPGENPDFWLEVDTTKPVASLLPPTVGTGAETGTMTILWTASDRGLQPEPISLYHAAQPTGPWTAIARGIRNEGIYRWTLPSNIGSAVFLRMEVTDRAGNVTRVETKSPAIIDPKSKVRVLGVTPAQMPGLE